MSSTNRGGKRTPADFYPTPVWVVHRLLDRVDLPQAGLWCEPCAGNGSIIRATQVYDINVDWLAIELLEDLCAELRADPVVKHLYAENALECIPQLPEEIKQAVSVVMTNPPFRLAQEFLRVCLLNFPYAKILFLLRLNFIGSSQRQAFFSRCCPDIKVLPNRPSFTSDRITDSTEYAWFMWESSPRVRNHGTIQVLDDTPVKERRGSDGR